MYYEFGTQKSCFAQKTMLNYYILRYKISPVFSAESGDTYETSLLRLFEINLSKTNKAVGQQSRTNILCKHNIRLV